MEATFPAAGSHEWRAPVIPLVKKQGSATFLGESVVTRALGVFAGKDVVRHGDFFVALIAGEPKRGDTLITRSMPQPVGMCPG